jgi:hypothetical protein
VHFYFVGVMFRTKNRGRSGTGAPKDSQAVFIREQKVSIFVGEGYFPWIPEIRGRVGGGGRRIFPALLPG